MPREETPLPSGTAHWARPGRCWGGGPGGAETASCGFVSAASVPGPERQGAGRPISAPMCPVLSLAPPPQLHPAPKGLPFSFAQMKGTFFTLLSEVTLQGLHFLGEEWGLCFTHLNYLDKNLQNKMTARLALWLLMDTPDTLHLPTVGVSGWSWVGETCTFGAGAPSLAVGQQGSQNPPSAAGAGTGCPPSPSI